jgi:prophage regulatory protein
MDYPTNLPETGFVRLQTILAVLPIGRSTFWARVKAGEYPRPIKLGPQTTVWRAEDIRALIEKLSGKVAA